MQGNSSLSSPGAPAAGASVAEEARQESRLHIAVPVKVCSDQRGTEWQSCCTYEISLAGARIASLPGIRQMGQVILIQRQNRRARYKVVWIGEPGTSLAGQVGVECMEPANVIWESEIKARIKSSR